MASPFTIFRRNQKILLALVTLMAMAAFVFIGPSAYYSQRRGANDPLVVETKYGNLHESELYNLRATRRVVEEFIRQLVYGSVMQLIEKRELDPRQADFQLRIMAARALSVLERPGGGALSEAAAVQTFVLAKRAEEVGMVVSDAVINEFLKQCSMDQLDDGQILRIIGQLRSQNLPMGEGRLFEALRRELLAFNYYQMFYIDAEPMPPAQRWDYFERINRRAEVELLAVPVASFVSKVEDPSEKELQQFFDEYKNRLPEPGSPEPGFKEPEKADFQYFKADFNQFVERAEKEVTDEQIQEYYEKNKDTRFRQAQLPPETEAKPLTPAQPPAKTAEPAKTGEKPAAQPEAKKPEEKSQEKPQEKPEEKPPAKASDSGEKPAPKADQPSASPAPLDGSDKAPAAPKSSAAAGRMSIRLVSATELAQADAGKSPPAKSDTAAPAAATATEAKQAAGESQPAAAESKPAADAKPAAEEAKPAAGEAQPASPPAEVKYEPLDKVKGVIRKELARTKAREALDKTIDELESIMRRYADELVLHEAQATPENKGVGAPAPPDFAALAKEHGLTAEDTGLVSAEQLRTQWDIGRSFIHVRDPSSRFGMRVEPFDGVAFNEATAKNKPLRSQAGDLHFLSWKIKTVEEQVPELDKVRADVVRAWKMIKARKLALEQARKYMDEAKNEKTTLAAAFGKQPELQVIKPPLFSWLTTGAVAQSSSNLPRVSEVQGVEQPGNKFMEAAFRLEPGQFDVAVNRPETMVYVVHLLGYDRQLDALFQQFAQEPPRMYQGVMVEDYFQPVMQSWIKHVMKDADVRWEREPAAERARVAAD